MYTKITSIITIVLIVSLVMCGLTIKSLRSQLDASNFSISTLKTEVNACKGIVDKMNIEIQNNAVDINSLQNKLDSINNATVIERTKVVTELVRDSSCENQLQQIANIQGMFYGIK